jgi:Holliday junction resolvase-like predicted endonuclease
MVVFVEVKTHKRHSSYAGRLWAIDRRKKSNLLRASANWLMVRKWHGNFRFDVIEIYGEQDGELPPEIDHIMNVKLFPSNWRFW